jgi:hypothetical protein
VHERGGFEGRRRRRAVVVMAAATHGPELTRVPGDEVAVDGHTVDAFQLGVIFFAAVGIDVPLLFENTVACLHWMAHQQDTSTAATFSRPLSPPSPPAWTQSWAIRSPPRRTAEDGGGGGDGGGGDGGGGAAAAAAVRVGTADVRVRTLLRGLLHPDEDHSRHPT